MYFFLVHGSNIFDYLKFLRQLNSQKNEISGASLGGSFKDTCDTGVLVDYET